jgi:ABC-2 type transport system permease protein
LLAVEGEALTSKLFDDYANRQFAAQKAQSGLKDTAGLFSPTIALQRVSMSASGTDLEGHRQFLAQAEAYRFAIVQQLNQLQATKVTYADDRNRNKDPEAAKRVRIDAKNWRAIPDFRYKASSIPDQMRTALPGLAILFGWLLALGFGLRLATRRLGAAA